MITKIKRYFIEYCYACRLVLNASKKLFIVKCVLSLVSALLAYFPLYFWRELINLLTDIENQNSSILVQTIWGILGGYCVLLLIQKIFAIISSFFLYKYNDAVEYYLEHIMIEKVSKADIAFFESSSLKNRLNNSWELIHSTKEIVAFVFDFLQAIIKTIISISLIATLSMWIIPIIVLLCVPSILGDKKIKDIEYNFEKEHTITTRKLEYYKEVFFGSTFREIKVYQLCKYLTDEYTYVWENFDAAIHLKNKKNCFIRIGSLIILSASDIIMYVFSILKLITKEIGVGDIACIISILSEFRENFSKLCFILNTFDEKMKEMNDVHSFIDMKTCTEISGSLILEKPPIIEFKDVSFKYPNNEYYVLKNCSFKINYGETIGLVGLNGCGKSTIVNLLCRFYDPISGEILINGKKQCEYNIMELRKLFGVLFQNFTRYSFTLKENIALSDIMRISDTKSIEKACIQSRVIDYSKNWLYGLDEELTKRFNLHGKELSVGQWQRVSLARALFRNAPVIILDEPSAALDPNTEHEIFDDFSKISSGRTAILISHRLSNIALCDRILVLEDGYIVEQGSHKELLDRCGRYAYLYSLQANKYKESSHMIN